MSYCFDEQLLLDKDCDAFIFGSAVVIVEVIVDCNTGQREVRLLSRIRHYRGGDLQQRSGNYAGAGHRRRQA